MSYQAALSLGLGLVLSALATGAVAEETSPPSARSVLPPTGEPEARAAAPQSEGESEASHGADLARQANLASTPTVDSGRGPQVLRAQILLDRARFSPGEIDGVFGSNTRRAIEGYQRQQGLPVTGAVDAATWAKLNADAAPVVVSHTLTAEDVAGPFVQVPRDMQAKARLERLGYGSVLEALGERLHASPQLLERLNPGGRWKAGATVWVPSVARGASLPAVEKVVVDKSEAVVRAIAGDGRVVAQYPATLGSHRDPLPIGEWTIQGVAKSPVFHYNPDLFWDADPSHSKAKIAPGPNNPVGTVWIDLSKEHYGIHGTPEPSTIWKTQSHGCIRLTNWDAQELAEAVAPGTPALLQE